MTIKKCEKCGISKPITEFNVYNKRPKGIGLTKYHKICSECFKPIMVRAYKNRKDRSEYFKNYRKKNVEKMQAKAKLNWAIDTGKIIQKPCEVCGNIKSDAHHTDYTKPYDVVWYCHKHHIQIHRVKQILPYEQKVA